MQQLVQSVLKSKDLECLSRYSLLSAEILSQSGLALERMRDEAKAMVLTMVEMEASYLTAEFFREILRAQDSDSGSLKTFSGRISRLMDWAAPRRMRTLNKLPITCPRTLAWCAIS